jgi:isopenicillin-N epimerase
MDKNYSGLWSLDTEVTFLNHGSFGACPKFVLDRQNEYRNQLENEPIRFLVQTVEPLLEKSREKIAALTGSQAGDLVFVSNATAGVNTVFRSLNFQPGDELLFTNHIYGACRKTLEFISFRTGVQLVEVVYPFPLTSSDEIVEAVLRNVTSRTKIALIDHITSATALVQPVEEITRELESRGIEVMIDGAHAPGSIPLNIEAIGASYYTANCHKWLCAPKGSAFLHLRKDKQDKIWPLVISHAGHEAQSLTERFYWPGTFDPSAWICVGDSIDYMASLLPGGWPEIMVRNRTLCLASRRLICETLQIPDPCPDSMIASMAAFPLPEASGEIPHDYKSFSVLQERLFQEHNIEIPVWNWDNPKSRLIRIAVQLYNDPAQYVKLSDALKRLT